ncbi:BnaC04g51390D [Brassica napus]|uniref:BnaC04g51390D protein n=1 Tax=Brassica napus TaxID=3708 RepID=A0A078GSA9_BRANA|nr:BnaC04g51390D [Brassica napus]
MAFLSKFGNAIRCMSSSKLFIGGMEYGMNEDSLREAFRKYGEVVESKNKNTGRGGLGLLHSPLQRRPLVLSKIMESDEFRASSKLETVTFSEMKHGEIEALVEFMYCVDGSISLESLKKHVGQLHYS